MSFSTLFFLGACWGCYRLGEFNERYPGVSRRYVNHAWQRLCEWLQK